MLDDPVLLFLEAQFLFYGEMSEGAKSCSERIALGEKQSIVNELITERNKQLASMAR